MPNNDKQYPTDIILDQLAEFHDKLHELDGAAGVHHHHRGANDIIVCTANCADDHQPLLETIDNDNNWHTYIFGPRKHDHDTGGSH